MALHKYAMFFSRFLERGFHSRHVYEEYEASGTALSSSSKGRYAYDMVKYGDRIADGCE